MTVPVTRARRACYLVLLAVAAGSTAQGQQAPPPTTTMPAASEEPVGFENPRSAMRGFLWAGRDGDWW